jgi:LDH2 family malate/lactate/ureidoglycolate dehydrogenase
VTAEAYPAKSLRELAEAIARHAGVRAEDAAILADALIYADLSGIGTHGVSRLPIYIERIERGLIDPTGQPQVVREATSAAVVDANGCLGQVAGVFAMRKAIELARQAGVGVVTVKHSQHFGAAGYYCKLAADGGLIGIGLTNSEPAMAPWGSYEAYLGTNPIALGCPTGRDFPIVIDLATSHVARGNIIAAAREGQPIPEGWALDAAGNPTTDAEAALDGSVLPLGGVKGYALALLVDMLSGVLSGAGFGTGVGSMYKDFTRPANVGHLVGAIDPAAFMPIDDFGARVATMIDEIHAKPTAPGFDAVCVPGEIEAARRLTRAKEGVPLTADVVSALRNLAEGAGIEWPQPLKEES